VLPPLFIDETVGGAWNQAVGLCFDEQGRMYVWEKGGLVWIVEDGVKSSAPLVDLSAEIGNVGNSGLMGFVLDARFFPNGHIHLFYAVPHAEAHFGRITRYTADAAGGFHPVDPASRELLVGETFTTGFPICSAQGAMWISRPREPLNPIDEPAQSDSPTGQKA
jgi:hypothetical protein